MISGRAPTISFWPFVKFSNGINVYQPQLVNNLPLMTFVCFDWAEERVRARPRVTFLFANEKGDLKNSAGASSAAANPGISPTLTWIQKFGLNGKINVHIGIILTFIIISTVKLICWSRRYKPLCRESGSMRSPQWALTRSKEKSDENDKGKERWRGSDGSTRCSASSRSAAVTSSPSL